jgi:hypothetical protein
MYSVSLCTANTEQEGYSVVGARNMEEVKQRSAKATNMVIELENKTRKQEVCRTKNKFVV